MDLLVIGIDGGTKEIIDNLPMPFTQSLFKTAKSKTLTEDLISRGWAEVLTGQHAADTKAFYLMPCADKSYDFSASYSKKDMVNESSSKPLWEVLNENGASVGIVNVPTTGPVDEVNGFFIAGGGGGLKAGGGIPKGMFYPEKYEKVLERNEYVFDVRLPGGTKTVSEFIKKITAAEECQKNTFIELSLAEKPHFGFHCFRITTEIQYLCRYEINRCMEGLKKAKHEGVDFLPTSTVQESIIRHYQKLDQHIEDIFKALAPKNFLFIGDHSTSSFEYEGNLDVWLANNGYLNKEGMYKAFKRRLTKFLSNKLGVNRANTAKIPAKKGLIRRPITKFDAETTKAFGTFYDTGNFAGIFINDEARFSGAINSEDEINELVDKICQEFNSDETNIKYQISAHPYKRNFLKTKFCKLMPDIKLQKPDNIYFSSRRWEYLVENPYMKPIDEPIEGKKYPYTGAKGSDPLFVYSAELDKFIHSEDPNDLRMTYRLIKRYFSNGAP